MSAECCCYLAGCWTLYMLLRRPRQERLVGLYDRSSAVISRSYSGLGTRSICKYVTVSWIRIRVRMALPDNARLFPDATQLSLAIHVDLPLICCPVREHHRLSASLDDAKGFFWRPAAVPTPSNSKPYRTCSCGSRFDFYSQRSCCELVNSCGLHIIFHT